MASDAPGSPASQEEQLYESLRVRPYVPGPGGHADAEQPVPSAVAAGAAEAFPERQDDPPTAPLPPVPPPGAPVPSAVAGQDEDTDVIDLGTVSAERPSQPAAAMAREPAPHPSRVKGRRRAGAHRRRRGALVAGAGIAAVGLAVGAVFLTAQLTGSPDRTEAAPDQGASEPAVELPSSAHASASAARSASPTASPTAPASVGASADVTASAPASASASSSSAATGGPTPGVTASRPASSGGGEASQPSGSAPPAVPATLRRGDTGSAVVDLQNRLKAVRFYYGPIDGDYSRQVGDAVARFQFFYGVKGDPQGVYGPYTRAALEARTGSSPEQGTDSGDNDDADDADDDADDGNGNGNGTGNANGGRS